MKMLYSRIGRIFLCTVLCGATASFFLALKGNKAHASDAITHRELGFSLYQQRKYDEARAAYETLQSIDPDDLAAHYILSIVYRRLGMKEKASHEAAMFADQKDDPTASTYAFEYLRKHNEVASETIPWHTHTYFAPESAHDVTSAP